MTLSSRVVVFAVIALLAVLVVRAYDKPGPGRIPAGCHVVDYGRDAYVDC